MKTKSHTGPPGKAANLSHFALWRALVGKDEDLDARDAASTFFRLFRSKHVLDLKVILYAACILVGVCLVIAACWAIFGGVAALFDFKGPPPAVALVGSVVPISGARMAWAYLTASKRLGVVDLFACEIAALCRVGTIFNVGQQRVETWRRIDERKTMDPQTRSIARSPRSPAPSNYVSQEDYFPIFDANSQDLETLEALVVGHITEFYTYMKASRDCQRKLAQAQTVEDAKEAAANIVYMLFLGYESARKAISDLVEFQPTRTENIAARDSPHAEASAGVHHDPGDVTRTPSTSAAVRERRRIGRRRLSTQMPKIFLRKRRSVAPIRLAVTVA